MRNGSAWVGFAFLLVANSGIGIFLRGALPGT